MPGTIKTKPAFFLRLQQYIAKSLQFWRNRRGNGVHEPTRNTAFLQVRKHLLNLDIVFLQVVEDDLLQAFQLSNRLLKLGSSFIYFTQRLGEAGIFSGDSLNDFERIHGGNLLF